MHTCVCAHCLQQLRPASWGISVTLSSTVIPQHELHDIYIYILYIYMCVCVYI